MVGGNALNGDAQDLARLLVGFRLGAGFGLADDGGRFVRHFVLQVIEQFRLRLVGRHAGDLFELTVDFQMLFFHLGTTTLELLFAFAKIAGTLVDLALHAGNLMLTRIERIAAMIERLLALIQAIFLRAHVLQTLGAFGFDGLAHFERLVLSLNFGFAAKRIGLLASAFDERLSFLGRLLLLRGIQCANGDEGDNSANSNADNGKDYFHRTPLPGNPVLCFKCIKKPVITLA